MEPTVTDANLLLGRLPTRLASGLELDVTAAAEALGKLGPADVVAAVNAEMLRALRVVSVERGHDPRELALVAFGGAGPLHACELAEQLEIATVVVPETAGVLSALGLVAGEERYDEVRSYLVPLDEAGELPREGEADLRYSGQSFELTVALQPDLAAAFHQAHEERYGFSDRDHAVELVAVRTAEVRPAPRVELPSRPPRRERGPARVELDGATLWIPPGWVGARDGPTWIVTRE
jgi:N-methylhydantoinase A